jgi:hypothetical protein
MDWSGIKGYDSDSSDSGNSSPSYTPASPPPPYTPASPPSPYTPASPPPPYSPASPPYPSAWPPPPYTSAPLPVMNLTMWLDHICMICWRGVVMGFTDPNYTNLVLNTRRSFVCMGCAGLICYECAASSVTHPDSCAWHCHLSAYAHIYTYTYRLIVMFRIVSPLVYRCISYPPSSLTIATACYVFGGKLCWYVSTNTPQHLSL